MVNAVNIFDTSYDRILLSAGFDKESEELSSLSATFVVDGKRKTFLYTFEHSRSFDAIIGRRSFPTKLSCGVHNSSRLRVWLSSVELVSAQQGFYQKSS